MIGPGRHDLNGIIWGSVGGSESFEGRGEAAERSKSEVQEGVPREIQCARNCAKGNALYVDWGCPASGRLWVVGSIRKGRSLKETTHRGGQEQER